MCSFGQGLCQISWQLPLPLAQKLEAGNPERSAIRQPLCSPGLVRAKLCGTSEYLHSLPVEAKGQGGEKRETETDIHTHTHQRKTEMEQRQMEKKTEAETHRKERERRDGESRGERQRGR